MGSLGGSSLIHSLVYLCTYLLTVHLRKVSQAPLCSELTNTMGTARAGGCGRRCISYPSRPPVGSSLIEEREMVEGATSRLETNPNLQRHSKGELPFRGDTA